MAQLPLLFATDAAEARGDARGALDLILEDLARRPQQKFWRPERLQRLLQLWVLESHLPRWATSRWILAQAAQSLTSSNRERMRRALEVARDLGVTGSPAGMDSLDDQAQIMDHDWVYRQVFLYELGGLQHFLDRVASPDLLAGADRIGDWAGSQMRGLRLLHEAPRTVTWCDLGDGEEIETENIGSATLLEPGDCAIGRLVPIEGGTMFETAPLFVPEAVARRVSVEPQEWLAHVRSGCREGGSDAQVIRTGRHDFPLLTDVPEGARLLVMADLAEALGLMEDEDSLDVEALELDLIRAAAADELPETAFGTSPLPIVGATLLNPLSLPVWARGLCAPEAPGLRLLAGRLAEPAATVCRLLAEQVEAAA